VLLVLATDGGLARSGAGPAEERRLGNLPPRKPARARRTSASHASSSSVTPTAAWTAGAHRPARTHAVRRQLQAAGAAALRPGCGGPAAEGRLRHAAWRGLRPDKAPEEARL
jgi:hypothetical protein